MGRKGRSDAKPATEPGMVTSEFALISPIYLLMVFLMIGGLVSAWQSISVFNEAKEIAREISIEGETNLASQAERSGGAVEVVLNGDVVEVTVRRIGHGIYGIAGVDFVGTHRMVVEPGVGRG